MEALLKPSEACGPTYSHMEYEPLGSPGFFSAAVGGQDDMFDHSFNLDDRSLNGNSSSNQVNMSWGFRSIGHMSLQPQAASHYPSPPPATIAFPDQQLCNDQYISDRKHLDANRQHAQQVPARLYKLNTDFNQDTVRFEHGQFTPPSKRVSPVSSERSLPSGTQEHIIQSPRSMSHQEQQTEDEAQSPAQASKKRTRRSKKRSPPSLEAEKAKREKLLERNRVAASKCRQKRKSYTSTLEEHARELQHRKDSLSMLANSLKDEVLFLKGQMLQHSDCGCTRVRDYLNNEADSLACRHSHLIPRISKTRNHSVFSSSSSCSPTNHGSPLFQDPAISPLAKEQSPDTLDALLRESLVQDTNDKGTVRRTGS